MELFWEMVFIGCGCGLVWAWWRAGQTGIIRARGTIMAVRERQPFFFSFTRTFVLMLGLMILALIPFFSGVRAIFGY